ncbi:MFS general substrate transporter [Lichtheimia hyalospora FSU 10163]|nr:MFS general substrate transporter [Lichtheimia hyalospora FSU 10163]
MPATGDLANFFQTDLTTINATIALYILAIGAAPLAWGPLSERIGRRMVYLISMGLYTVFTVICGIASNLGLFFVFRILQGVAASSGMAVGGGSVADLFHPHERGRAMSVFMISTIFGPAFSPIVGGYVDQYLGWRWIFYVSAMIGGVVTVVDLFFLRETLYQPVDPLQEKIKPTTYRQKLARLKFNPLKSIRLLGRPDVFLISMQILTAFGCFFYMVTILPITYETNYGFDTGSRGLLYLTGGVGNISGSTVAGFVSDRVYRYKMKKNGHVKSEDRLLPMYIGAPFLVIGYLLYGWLLHFHVHWFPPLIGYALATFGCMFTVTTGMTYLTDCYLPISASVVSAANFCRNLGAMIFSLPAVQIRDSLGDGWSYTLAMFLCLVIFIACIPTVHMWGPRMREWKDNRGASKATTATEAE